MEFKIKKRESISVAESLIVQKQIWYTELGTEHHQLGTEYHQLLSKGNYINKTFFFSSSSFFFSFSFFFFFSFFYFFFHWYYSPLWALACRTISLNVSLSATNSLHLLTPSTWRSLSTSSFHLFLGLPLLLVPSSSWVKIFLGILSSSILSRWPNQLILCSFIHFTIFSPLLKHSQFYYYVLFRLT